MARTGAAHSSGRREARNGCALLAAAVVFASFSPAAALLQHRARLVQRDHPSGAAACDYCERTVRCGGHCKVGKCSFTAALPSMCSNWTWSCPEYEEERQAYWRCSEFRGMQEQCALCSAGCDKPCFVGRFDDTTSPDGASLSFSCGESAVRTDLVACAALGS
eukprot:gene171-188_t